MKDKRYLFLILLLIGAASYGQRKIKDGTVTGSSDLPATNAVVELESNNKGLLLPRLTTVQRDAISGPENGLMVYNTTTKCIDYYNGSAWVSKCAAETGTAVISNIDCKDGTGFNNQGLSEQIKVWEARQTISVTVSSPGIYFFQTDVKNGIMFAGSADFKTVGTQNVVLSANGIPLSSGPFTYTVDGKCSFTVNIEPSYIVKCDGTQQTTVVEVTSATGRVWMDRNLGATRAATSILDPLARGCRFQWGKGNDGTVVMRESYYQSDIENINIINTYNYSSTAGNWQGLNGINNPCPSGFRLPTDSEWAAEKTTYGFATLQDAFASPLKLVSDRKYTYDGSGFLGDDVMQQLSATLWTSTLQPSSTTHAVAPYFNQFFINIGGTMDKTNIASVRCIKN